MKVFYSICIALFLTSSLYAQAEKSVYAQTSVLLGKIAKHKAEITFPADELSYGLELTAFWQTRGDKAWQELQGFPKLGLSLTYIHLGDKNILGSAFGFMPSVSVNIFRKPKSAFFFNFGSGMAYLTKPYNKIDNTQNNAIGSNWNNSVTIKFNYDVVLSEQLVGHIGLVFAHYSNGARKLPNLGINIPMLSLGLSPNKGSYKEDYFHFLETQKKDKKRLGLTANFQYTLAEIRVPGGPKYPIYGVTLESHYYISKINRLVFGYLYEFNRSIYEFGLQTLDFANDAEARIGASRHSINIGDEFLFGNWGVHLQAGFYIKQRTSFLLPRPFYFKLSPRYYFPVIGKSKLRAYTGIHLKSHLFVAEYIAIGFGLLL